MISSPLGVLNTPVAERSVLITYTILELIRRTSRMLRKLVRSGEVI
jgi:hypothetical protein